MTTTRPRLLDLFCGAGGCSVGYERAGFAVTGVDLAPQRHYRGGTFVQADALEYLRDHGHEFDAIHASPPCQAHSSMSRFSRAARVDLIPTTRQALIASGKAYVIENVAGAPLGVSASHLLTLCGTMFGLVTPDGRAELRRHRLFEANWSWGLWPACQHGRRAVITVVGTRPFDPAARHPVRLMARRAAGLPAPSEGLFSADDARAAMGIPWMPMKALSQAIPPAYTRWIGERLLAALQPFGNAE